VSLQPTRATPVPELTARPRQRTDSTRVLAVTRDLNRLELVGETLRAALDGLATVACHRGWCEVDPGKP
jgi:hypothetical protein